MPALVGLSVVLLAALAHAAEPWPKETERGFAQDSRTARMGEIRVFAGVEFWVEPDEPELEACAQRFDKTKREIHVEFVRRGRCSVKFTKGLTGYEVGYSVERDPKDFAVPSQVTVKVGQAAHVPCVSAVVFARSRIVKLIPDLEENGFTYIEGRSAGTERVRCTGRREKKTLAVTVVP